MRRALLLLAILALAGCGGGGSSTTGATTSTSPATTTSTAQMPLTIYPVRGGAIRPESVQVPQTPAVAAAALRALGLAASVTVANGTATVDLPDATAEQVAEVVYTLTQFPSVQRVDVGGRTGVTRDEVSAFAPLILVEQPAANATVPRDVRVSGTAIVFEGTVVVELVRNGQVLVRHVVTASAGAPQRGSFSTTLAAPSAGPATVVAFAPSAENGAPQHEMDVPVTIGP